MSYPNKFGQIKFLFVKILIDIFDENESQWKILFSNWVRVIHEILG